MNNGGFLLISQISNQISTVNKYIGTKPLISRVNRFGVNTAYFQLIQTMKVLPRKTFYPREGYVTLSNRNRAKHLNSLIFFIVINKH